MTVLEELVDLSLKSCENGRVSGQKNYSRGAALLDSSGKVYSGCDVSIKENDPNAIVAEKAAFLSAVSSGAIKYEV